MSQVSSKVYYNIGTGQVLLITAEMEGDIFETAKEYDFSVYEDLQQADINQTDYIIIEYGKFQEIFNNAKAYNVDVETKKLNVEYYSTEELQALQNMILEREQFGYRISDISSYLEDQTDMISSIEDQILQTELNKLTEGMN